MLTWNIWEIGHVVSGIERSPGASMPLTFLGRRPSWMVYGAAWLRCRWRCLDNRCRGRRRRRIRCPEPTHSVQTCLAEPCKFWSDGWMIRITARPVEGNHVKCVKLHFDHFEFPERSNSVCKSYTQPIQNL